MSDHTPAVDRGLSEAQEREAFNDWADSQDLHDVEDRSGALVGWLGRSAIAASAPSQAEPIDMVLHCPKCGLQHVDAPEDADCDGEVAHTHGWSNPPHRSHLCHSCGCIWRPADVTTNGVAAIQTKGKADTWEASQEQAGERVEDVALMREALSVIAGGDGCPIEIAQQTLDMIAAPPPPPQPSPQEIINQVR